MAWKELIRWSRSNTAITVELSSPHQVYRPGDSISGQVLVDLKSRTANAGVNILFKGALRLKGSRPHGRVQESVIFDEDIKLCEGASFEAGKHSFPFELQLPSEGLLECMDFDLGSILYTVKARIADSSGPIKQSQHRAVKVSTTRDVGQLNQHKNVTLVVNVSKRKAPKQVTIKLMIPRRGWLPGEDVPVKLLVEHQWAIQGASCVAITLSRISHFVVGGSEYTYRKDLSQSILSLYTEESSKRAELSTNLKVPPESLISASTKFISFSYLIEVTADINGKIDLHDWANANPAINMIDTDRVRNRPGVVTAWAEVVVGSFRGQPEESSSRAGTISDVMHANLSPPSSLASSDPDPAPGGPAARPAQSQCGQLSALSEKQILAARAQTLIPSVPEYPDAAPLSPSAPETAAQASHAGSDEKNALRLRQLASDPVPDYGGAPAYGADLAPSAPSAPP